MNAYNTIQILKNRKRARGMAKASVADQALKRKKVPVPLILNASYLASEKFDEHNQVFCRELPGIITRLNDDKSSIHDKKAILFSTKEKIRKDLEELEGAKKRMDDLYNKELQFKFEKEKELDKLKSQLATAQNRKMILCKLISKYSIAKESLDDKAESSNRFENALHMVQYFLILQALNEKFLNLEYEYMEDIEKSEDTDLDVRQELKEHHFKVLEYRKKLTYLLDNVQRCKNASSQSSLRLMQLFSVFMKGHLNTLEVKQWISNVYGKISQYKDVSHTDNILAQLCEIVLLLAVTAYASIYELPVAKTVILKHDDNDDSALLHYDLLPSKSYQTLPSKSYVTLSSKHYLPSKHLVTLPLQSLVHPALSGYHYPTKKYTLHYPSGVYHGPHGTGIYSPKFHDTLEEAYYRG